MSESTKDALGTPSGALVFQACVAILLVLTGTYHELYSYSMFATWTFFALTAVALIRLRITSPELPRPFKVWGYPFTPVVFGIVALAIAVNLWLLRPVRSSSCNHPAWPPVDGSLAVLAAILAAILAATLPSLRVPTIASIGCRFTRRSDRIRANLP